MEDKKPDVDDEVLQEFYTWIDKVPLSRPKKDMKRDFSDGGKNTSIFKVLCTINFSIDVWSSSFLLPEDCRIAQLSCS